MKNCIKNILTALFILFCFALKATETPNPQQEQAYIAEGKRQLENLMRQNAINDANGESFKNTYVFFLVDQTYPTTWSAKNGFVYDFGYQKEANSETYVPLRMLPDASDMEKVNKRLTAINTVPNATPIYVGLHKEAIIMPVINLLTPDATGLAKLDNLQPEQKADIKTLQDRNDNIYLKIATEIDRTKYPNYAIMNITSFLEVKNGEAKVNGESKIGQFTKTWWMSNYSLNGSGFTNEETKNKIRTIVFNNFSPYPEQSVSDKIIEFADRIVLGIDNYDNMATAERCDFGQIDDLAIASQAAKTKLYDKIKAQTIELANNARTFVTFDNPAAFKESDKFNTQVLPERLQLLADYGGSGYKVYVVFKRVPFAFKKDGKDQIQFAQDVGTGATTLIKDNKTILMVVPYYVSYCLNNNGLFGTVTADVNGITMPAVYCRDRAITDNINNAIKATSGTIAQNWEKLFGEAFKKVPKKHVLYKYAYNVKFDLNKFNTEIKEYSEQSAVGGYDRIFDYELLYDYRSKKLEAAYDEYASVAVISATGDQAALATSQLVYDKFVQDITNINNESPQWVRFNQDLKEKVLFDESNIANPSAVVTDFTAWFKDEAGGNFIKKWSPGIGTMAPAAKNYVSGFNPAVKEKVFAVIDVTCLVLSPFGADAAADAVGIYAAFFYDDTQMKVIYSAALLIPASGFALRAYRDGFSKGKLLAKAADGKWRFLDNIVDVAAYAKGVYKNFTAQEFKTYFRITGATGTLLSKEGGTTLGRVLQREGKDLIEVEGKEILEQVTGDYTIKGALKDAEVRIVDNGTTVLETTTDLVVAEHKNGSKCLIGSPFCFAKGTLVKTDKGSLPIEQITEGMSVYSYDEIKQEKVVNKVVRTFRNAATTMMRLVVGKDTILTTPEHPFYVLDPSAEIRGTWTRAGDLQAKAKVLLLTGAMAFVNMVQPIDTFATVYNFEVANTHNYFVGTEGVLAHNNCTITDPRCYLGPLKKMFNDDVAWYTFADKLKALNITLTKAERQAFNIKLNESFLTTGDKAGLEKFIVDFNAGDNVFNLGITKNPNFLDTWIKFRGTDFSRNLNYLEFFNDMPKIWTYTQVGVTIEVKNAKGPLATITKDKIIAPARTLSGKSGNAILNKETLAKETLFDVDGFLYQTDNLGRVVKTNADLDDLVRIRLGNQQIKSVDIKDGTRGMDQGGHIIAARFFGPGEQINYYPMASNLNLSEWKQMENTWASALANNSDVRIEVEAVFNGISKRPTDIKVRYTIDGQPFLENFKNP